MVSFGWILPVSYTHLDVYKRQELEGRMPFIVLNHIRSHLQRRINDNPIGYLLCQGGVHTAVSFMSLTKPGRRKIRPPPLCLAS